MLQSVHSLIGFTLGAIDGAIGTIKDFYFDDRTWNIRYLIIETGGWLFGRKVLLSPIELRTPDWERKVFLVNLTQEQIKNSPDINTDKPVSLQQEMELRNHYGWSDYTGQWGMGFIPVAMAEGIDLQNEDGQIQKDGGRSTQTATAIDDPHLRSCKKITGYTVHGIDSELGEVRDYLIDIYKWRLPFFIITTRNWYSGKTILVTTTNIKNIEWESSGRADALK